MKTCLLAHYWDFSYQPGGKRALGYNFVPAPACAVS